MAGRFIIIDGPDGGGTTRHTQLLCIKLEEEGFTVCKTAEPTGGPIGTDIRRILHTPPLPDPAALQLLFTADRAQHVAEVIRPALGRGEIIVCDRYRLSTIIYGAAQGVDATWLQSVNDYFPKPDLTILTLPPLSVCMERLAERTSNDQLEAEPIQRAVYELYKSMTDGRTVSIDTSVSKENAAAEIWQHVSELLA